AVQNDGLPPELRRKVLAWLTDAAATRKVVPAVELSGLEKLIVGEAAANDPALQRAAIRLAATWKSSAILPALQALAADKNTKPDLHKAAIAGLVTIGDASTRGTLERLASDGNNLQVRMQAAAGLSGIDLPAAAQLA